MHFGSIGIALQTLVTSLSDKDCDSLVEAIKRREPLAWVAGYAASHGETFDADAIRRFVDDRRPRRSEPVILGTMRAHTAEDIQYFKDRRDERRRKEAERPSTFVAHEPGRG
jgi:hypothetical protein